MNPSKSATSQEIKWELTLTKDKTCYFDNNRRRQRMEGAGGISKGGGGGGDHQMRRLHIIYFLSRMGKIDQPHLIRVHHLHKNGVRLRDIKRWLADLRGKDIPDAFAWSYKRKYKNGYVWQDLMDDDLITPICDNEYVLKGSDISLSSPVDASSFVAITKDRSELKTDRKVQAGGESHKEKEDRANNTISQEVEENEDASPRRSYQYFSRISTSRKSFYEESPVFSSDGSTITEESNKKEEQEEDDDDVMKKNSYSKFYTLLSRDKENKEEKMIGNHEDEGKGNNKNHNNNVDKVDTSNSSFSSSSSHSGLEENKSRLGRTSNIFRNLISCRAIDTNDDVLMPISNSVKLRNINKDCNLDHNKGGWSTRGSWKECQQQPRRSFEGFMGSRKEQQGSGHGNTGRVPAAYKPVGAPTCSQCGKSFRPEKLHTHMKSCIGMKAFTKAASLQKKKKMQQSHDLPVDPSHGNHQIVTIS